MNWSTNHCSTHTFTHSLCLHHGLFCERSIFEFEHDYSSSSHGCEQTSVCVSLSLRSRWPAIWQVVLTFLHNQDLQPRNINTRSTTVCLSPSLSNWHSIKLVPDACRIFIRVDTVVHLELNNQQSVVNTLHQSQRSLLQLTWTAPLVQTCFLY